MPIGTLIGFLVVAVAMILVFGVPPLLARATTPATASEAVAGGVRALTLFAMLFFLVPTFAKIFADFGMDLPVMTEWIVTASSAAGVWVPTFLLFAAGETLVFYLLYRDPARRWLARGLSVAATFACVVAVLLIGAAIGVALPRGVNDLG